MGRIVFNTMQKANAKNVAVFVTRYYIWWLTLGIKKTKGNEKVVNDDVLLAYKIR